VTSTWEQFFEELVQETDVPEGNSELVSTLMERLPLDFSRLLADRGLVAMAASDGCESYLAKFLSEPQHLWDVCEVAAACFFNQSARIPLTFMLLQLVDLTPYADEIGDMLREFFVDIASDKKAIPKENRTLKMLLLRQIFVHMPWVAVDVEQEGPDGQTVFTRALNEGDVDVVELLLEREPCVITDINRKLQVDGSTALIQAVIGNHFTAVSLLFSKFPTVDVSIRSENGNALDLAVALGRDSRIIGLLREHGAQPSGIKVDKSAASPRKIRMKAAVSPSSATPNNSRPSTSEGPTTGGPQLDTIQNPQKPSTMEDAD